MQFVLASLAMWGGLIYGGLKMVGGKKEDKPEVFISPKPWAILLFFLS
jgi:hypothetical protein